MTPKAYLDDRAVAPDPAVKVFKELRHDLPKIGLAADERRQARGAKLFQRGEGVAKGAAVEGSVRQSHAETGIGQPVVKNGDGVAAFIVRGIRAAAKPRRPAFEFQLDIGNLRAIPSQLEFFEHPVALSTVGGMLVVVAAVRIGIARLNSASSGRPRGVVGWTAAQLPRSAARSQEYRINGLGFRSPVQVDYPAFAGEGNDFLVNAYGAADVARPQDVVVDDHLVNCVHGRASAHAKDKGKIGKVFVARGGRFAFARGLLDGIGNWVVS